MESITEYEMQAACDTWYHRKQPYAPKEAFEGLRAKGYLNATDNSFTEAGRNLFLNFSASPVVKKELIVMAKKTTTAVAVAEAPKAPVKKVAAKTPAAAAATAAPVKKTVAVKGTPPSPPVKKTVAHAPVKGLPAKGTKKEGLRAPQIKILSYLAKPECKAGKTRPEISQGAPVDSAMCTEYIGSTKDEIRLQNDTKHFPSLVSLGFIVPETVEGIKGLVYKITDAGKAALKAAGA